MGKQKMGHTKKHVYTKELRIKHKKETTIMEIYCIDGNFLAGRRTTYVKSEFLKISFITYLLNKKGT